VELREYVAIALKWWWLLVLCTILGAGVAFAVSTQMPPTFEAFALMLIGGSLEALDPTTGELATSEKLAQTYAELIKTRQIQQATMDALGLPHEPEVTVTLVRNTQLLRITVADQFPDRAAATANELARQLILQSPSDPERDEQGYREFVRSQLADLEQEIEALSQAILDQKDTMAQEDLLRLEEELNARRANYSALVNYIKGSSVNHVTVFETAAAPSSPTGPKVLQNTVLAAVVGFMLAAGAAFLIEYLDDSVRGPVDAEEASGVPVLGTIAEMGDEIEEFELVAVEHPRSHVMEAYRMLRTNIRYLLPASEGIRSLLFTSVGPAEGKTTVSANVAVVMAMAGQRVILIDADMRRPRQDKVWGYTPNGGLSSYLVGDVEDVSEVLVATEVEGLLVLPSGPIPPNPAELLNSQRMLSLIDLLKQRADVILFDSPPVLAVTDAVLLASMVTSSLLVVEAGRTKIVACAHAAEVLNRAAANLSGVILNRFEISRRGYGYGGYGYGGYGYGGYGVDDEAGEPRRRKRGRRRRKEAVSD
jgi:capsular exopolysaccharide synthesis family protein